MRPNETPDAAHVLLFGHASTKAGARACYDLSSTQLFLSMIRPGPTAVARVAGRGDAGRPVERRVTYRISYKYAVQLCAANPRHYWGTT